MTDRKPTYIRILPSATDATDPPKSPKSPTSPSTELTSRQIISNYRHGDYHPEVRIERIADEILKNEHARGGFFFHALDGRIYLFDGDDRHVHELLNSKGQIDPNFGHLLDVRYGLLYTERLTRHVVCRLESFARSNEHRPAVYRFAFYNRDKNVLYISRYNGTCYRIDGDTIEIISNGKEVLFLDDDGGIPCDANIGAHDLFRGALLDDLQFVPATRGGLLPLHQKLQIECWFYALAFGERLNVKPILVMEGDPGSGKSTAIQRAQFILQGRQDAFMIPRSSSPEDLLVAMLRRQLILIDDLNTFVDWMGDVFTSYVTGASLPRRKRFTDDSESRLAPRGFIAIASNNPVTLYRSDVADRLIICRLQRRRDTGFLGTDVVFQRILGQRELVLGEWLFNLNRIVKALKDAPDPPPSQYRLVDFANFCYLVAPLLGYTQTQVTESLATSQREREEFSAENDPLLEVIERWTDFKQNRGRPSRAGSLFTEFSLIAEQMRIKLPFRTPRGLTKHLNDTWRALERHFRAKKINDAHNKQLLFIFDKGE